MIDTLTDAQLARARARTHERINDELITPRRRRSPAPALVAATALAAFAVVLAPNGSPGTATAATVLRGLDPQPLPTLASGEYYAVRIVQRDAAEPAKALDLRYWVDANGKGRQRSLLDGKQRSRGALAPPPGARMLPELRDFPTEPAALAAKMRELAVAMRLGEDRREPTTRDYILAASQMVTDHRGTPPEVLRAVFGFLSGLPGMKLVGEVTDPLGRPGVAVAADGDPNRHEGVGVELIVNPATGRPLALVHYRGDVGKPWQQTIREEGVVRDTRTLP